MKKILISTGLIIILLLSFCGCQEQKNPDENGSLENNNYGDALLVREGNYTSIQAAVNAAKEGATIVVFSGTYYETIIIDKSINLIAKDPESTILRLIEKNQDHPDFIEITADHCLVEGFTIIGDYPLSYASGVSVKSSNNIIRNNTFLNINNGVFLDDESEYNNISFNTISDSQNGIFLRLTNNNNVSSNLCLNNSYGIYLDHSYINNISKNNITTNIWGIKCKGATSNQIFRNQIFNNNYGLTTCCGATSNVIYYNNFYNNDENAKDNLFNNYDNGTVGNFWDDFTLKYLGAGQIGDIWDRSYSVTGGVSQDRYPFVNPIPI